MSQDLRIGLRIGLRKFKPNKLKGRCLEKNTCPVWLAQVTLFSIVLYLVEVAFEEVAHAVLGEGGCELGAKVAFAVDVK